MPSLNLPKRHDRVPRRLRTLPRDVRRSVGGFDSTAFERLTGQLVEIDVDRLAEDLRATVTKELGACPVPEETQYVFRDWKHAQREAGVDVATLELAARRAQQYLSIGEALAP